MKVILGILPILILVGCGKPKPDHSRLIGEYEGLFGDSPITLAITSINDSALAGFSRHLEIERPLKGIFRFDGTDYCMKLAEPGNHPFDGTFVLRTENGCKKNAGLWFPKNLQNLAFVSLKLQRKR